jgi:DNA-binding transcriptional LysR family regulator
MNWNAISFDWNQVRAFLATAEEGSLSAAARALRSTQPTVGRQVSALEAHLGVTLFERAGRALVMTAAGHDLLEHVQAMGDAASRISIAAAGQSQDVVGRVTITASELVAAAFLPPVMHKLRTEAPGIQVEIVVSDKIEDLTRRDADIAIRHVRPDQPDLIARHLADATAGFYASKNYLEVHGRPKNAADLSNHVFVGPRETAQMFDILETHGVSLSPDQFKLSADSGVVIWEMMRAGLGMTIMPQGIWPHFTDVEPVLPDLARIKFPVWLVTHRELKTSRRIRIVFDALADVLSKTFALKA